MPKITKKNKECLKKFNPFVCFSKKKDLTLFLTDVKYFL